MAIEGDLREASVSEEEERKAVRQDGWVALGWSFASSALMTVCSRVRFNGALRKHDFGRGLRVKFRIEWEWKNHYLLIRTTKSCLRRANVSTDILMRLIRTSL